MPVWRAANARYEENLRVRLASERAIRRSGVVWPALRIGDEDGAKFIYTIEYFGFIPYTFHLLFSQREAHVFLTGTRRERGTAGGSMQRRSDGCPLWHAMWLDVCCTGRENSIPIYAFLLA